MKKTKLLKVIGAILLLLSMTLPMSSCTVTKSEGSDQLVSTTDVKVEKTETEYQYVMDHIDLNDPGTWLTFLAFGWPFLIISLLQWKNTGLASVIIRVVELLLLIGSLLWIDFIATFLADRREIGAYVAYLALAVYAVGAIWIDVTIYRDWKRTKLKT